MNEGIVGVGIWVVEAASMLTKSLDSTNRLHGVHYEVSCVAISGLLRFSL